MQIHRTVRIYHFISSLLLLHLKGFMRWKSIAGIEHLWDQKVLRTKWIAASFRHYCLCRKGFNWCQYWKLVLFWYRFTILIFKVVFFFPPLKSKFLHNRASKHQNDFCHFSKLHDNKRSQAGSSSLVFNKIIWFRTEKLNLKVTTKSIFLHCIIQNISLDSHPILQRSEQVSKLT